MGRWNMTYHINQKKSPVSYWVHKEVREKQIPYDLCREYRPPFPLKDPLRGWPYLRVSASGFDFEFASLHELNHCINILGKKLLPTTQSLSHERGSGKGPNSHWLSRLPAKLKSWKKREKIVSVLRQVKQELKKSQVHF